MQTLRIKTKLFLLIGMMTAIIFGVAAVGILRLRDMNVGLDQVGNNADIQLVGARMNEDLVTMNRAEYRVAGDPSSAAVQADLDASDENRKLFEQRLKTARGAADTEDMALLDEIGEQYRTYRRHADTLRSDVRSLGAAVTLSDAQRRFAEELKSSRSIADVLQDDIKRYVDHLDKKGEVIGEKAQSDGQSAIVVMSATAVGGTLFGLVLGFLLATFGISRPLNRSVTELNRLAGGDLETLVSGAERGDECGDVARGLEIFKANAVLARNLEAEAVQRRQLAEAEHRGMMMSLADGFEVAIGGIVEIVSSAATEMQATASQLTASAEETAAQSNSVSSSAEETGSSVTAVASSAEELGASVNEIGRQVERSAQKSRAAVSEAEATAAIVSELRDAASRIDDIVDLISGIAGQTNLLALNATIEAARAGEAGRGFAVVAQEVKSLAEQTAKATTDIGRQILGIQVTTTKAVDAIGGISLTIREINEVASAIASAVEEQGAATREIVHAITCASVGTREVSANIVGVARAAAETGTGASQVLSASAELAVQASRLQNEMHGFLQTVRAA